MALCFRCGVNETGKLIDKVPVCTPCMLKDAKGNRNRVTDYSALTPINQKKTNPVARVRHAHAKQKRGAAPLKHPVGRP